MAGTERFRLARLNPDGSIDPTFTAVFGESVGPVAVQADGRILVGGTFSIANEEQRRGIVRLLPDVAIDPSFTVGSGVDGSVSAFNLRSSLAQLGAEGEVLVHAHSRAWRAASLSRAADASTMAA